MQSLRELSNKQSTKFTQPPTGSLPSKSKPSAGCPDCDGQKYVRFDVAFGDPRFGKAFPCPTCNQVQIQIISGLTGKERDIRLEDIKAGGRPGTAKAVEAAREFIADPRGFLSIHGDFGNGKTTILMAMVNVLVNKGIEARYLTAAALMGYLRESFNKESNTSDYERLHELAAMPVLVIDELDKLRDTPYSRELQQELINRRYREAGTLGTVLAWNGDVNALPWGAVVSRLSEFTVVHNTDSDMRKLLGKVER